MAGCSRKKDKFLNRNFHALTTRYNILYNGYIALEKGKLELESTYQDNYWDILPVERMQEKDEVQLPGQKKNSNFEKAEEKATKAIQKHSMNINGREKNSQIDEAFLLLGKARYYDERMIPAMEAFNYVLKKYPKSSGIVQAKTWREKVNIRLDNDELALSNLKKIFKRNTMDEQEHADIRAMMAEAYINLKEYDSAATSLSMAADLTKSNEERGRYLFIIGQLYNKIAKKAKANATFDKLIKLNRKSPRVYMINAYIQKARNFNWERGDKNALLGMLNKLAKNRENRPYLDIIYHELGNYYLHTDNIEVAADFYRLSLSKHSTDLFLNAQNYDRLAEMEFNEVRYKPAGKYYDSTLLNLKENTKMYRLVKKKRDNLDDVIYFEDVAFKNDSILYVVNMTDKEKEVYYTNVIDSIKAQRKAEEEKRKLEALKAANAAKARGKSNSFYFYNESTVTYGKNEFKRVWGNRKLEDEWRLSDKSLLSNQEFKEMQEEVTDTTSIDKELTLEYYLSKIPTDEKYIDSIYRARNYAYYQLGLIYFAKFKEYQLAANRLESLLANKPDEKLILPAKYNLYKIYQQLKPSRAEVVKQEIIFDYPDSRYAMLLQNPYAQIKDDENSPDAVVDFYNKLFENQEFVLLLEEIDGDIAQYSGEEAAPKLEMLKASATGRLKGVSAYKKALEFVSLNYPASDEGKRAAALLQKTIRDLEKLKFEQSIEGVKSWKWVVPYNSETQASVKEFNTSVVNAIAALEHPEVFDHLTFSYDVYDDYVGFFVVHGFRNTEEIKVFKKMLEETKDLTIPEDEFFITSGNYSILQIHKNLKEYREPNLP
ncbi:gliding motility protein [Neptunitalea chrysea]|uniref:Gliding motility protein n=1 Tax=Neptunitalea chrysea TaxID=1647581 RepID=A0A9W6B7Q9_9FLAO|nr:gliding motility protein [Neptunitalea chrysea]